jgi:GT2 family glycosyltransferase
LKAFVVVATKGRAKETYTLLDFLAKQTYPIEKIFIVGSEPADIAGLENHPLTTSENAIIKTSQAGSCIQRNVGLDQILDHVKNVATNNWFVAFFDDDYRPAESWMETCANTFKNQQDCVGLGGRVIADGVTAGTISEEEAQAHIEKNAPIKRVEKFEPTYYGLYGCNMAYRGSVAGATRFDENLPLYAWQEDLDYGARAIKMGKLLYTNQCVGVHLGVTSGRTSGVRFGYSQIANPIYLVKKGTMTKKYAKRIMLRNFMSNCFHTIIFDNKKDYKGRLYGNSLAFSHLITNKIHPTKILEI